MRTTKNILYHTFIGINTEVINSSSVELIGKKGKIVDETKNLIIIESDKESDKENDSGKATREIKIPKNSCTFRFYTEDKLSVDVEGKKITFKPEDRAKKI